MKIAVIYSLPTSRALATPFLAADEDTKDSAVGIARALSGKGNEVELLPISEESIDSILLIRADCIFNLIEWTGLDTSLALAAFERLEKSGIPFTGASRPVFGVTADKAKMKQALFEAGLPTPRWQQFTTGEESVDEGIQLPIIVKPVFEHCSIGLTEDAVVTDPMKLRKEIQTQLSLYKQPVFIEEFVIGREFQMTVLEKKEGPVVLPPAEILFSVSGTHAFLTYASRWIEGHPDYETSRTRLATLDQDLKNALEEISKKAFISLGYQDYSRLDIRVRSDNINTGNPKDSRYWTDSIYILEANTNPGLEDDEGYGMSISFHAAGMSFADFLFEIVQSCLRRATGTM